MKGSTNREEWMSPSRVKERTEVISVVCSMSLAEMPQDVKALEERIMERGRMSGREFYARVFAAFQQRWLEEARSDYTAVRWRSINQVTPFGLVRLPVRSSRRRTPGPRGASRSTWRAWACRTSSGPARA